MDHDQIPESRIALRRMTMWRISLTAALALTITTAQAQDGYG
jgi:hypothetical protein